MKFLLVVHRVVFDRNWYRFPHQTLHLFKKNIFCFGMQQHCLVFRFDYMNYFIANKLTKIWENPC
jgi:hypothetical protein